MLTARQLTRAWNLGNVRAGSPVMHCWVDIPGEEPTPSLGLILRRCKYCGRRSHAPAGPGLAMGDSSYAADIAPLCQDLIAADVMES